ncbi:MAG: hypothetical protein AB1758_37905 [Candidatus Eremiobacterota bacterium]
MRVGPNTSSPGRPARWVRTAVAGAAGLANGLYSAANGVPEGLVAGLMAHRGAEPASIRKAVAVTQLVTNTLAGAVVGGLVAGPAGLVMGAAAGYVTGTVGNYMEHRSQQLDAVVDRIRAGSGGVLRALWTGASQGAVQGFRFGRVSGAATAAGFLDGVREVGKAPSATVSPELAPRTLLEGAASVLFGVAGVLINAPAGAVLGSLRSVHDPARPTPTRLERHLLLLATNVGKVLPGVVLGSLIPGPVGILAGTAVGLLTASITSMVDGKAGFHPGLVNTVRQAVASSHGQEECPDSARVFYRGGRGTVVGFCAGLREGWRAGCEAGVQIVRDGLSGPDTSVGTERDTQS